MSIISNYLGTLYYAVLAFPLLALALSFPYIVFEYRHYGAIPLLRTIIVYTMILYMICAYFLVIMPLPSRAEVAASPALPPQLRPGHFLWVIRNTVTFSIHDRSTWKAALKDPCVYEPILNLFLLFPLGVYLHYYFRRGIFSSVILIGLMSLFFEWTQLSGLYGLYAHAYRFFDVDDIILNTAGGVAGWIFSPLICLPLPSRERIDGTAYERGVRIPMFRRFLAFLLDFALISLPVLGLLWVLPANAYTHAFAVLLSMALSVLYFTLLPAATRGYTLGSALLRLRLVTGFRSRTQAASLQDYCIRAVLLSLLIAHLPHYWALCQEMKQITYGHVFNFWRSFQLLAQLGASIFVIEILVRIITGDRIFFYERFSNVHNISTIASGFSRSEPEEAAEEEETV